MGRIDLGLVGKGHQLVVERVIELSGEFFFGNALGTQKIRAADVTDEESIAGEDTVGDGVVGVFENNHADGLWRMPGSVSDLQNDLAQFDAFAVGEFAGFELGLANITKSDGGPGLVSQFEVAGKEIGMEMGFDDQFDRHVVLGCGLEVRRNVAAGVHHHGSPGRLVTDEIRGL